MITSDCTRLLWFRALCSARSRPFHYAAARPALSFIHTRQFPSDGRQTRGPRAWGRSESPILPGSRVIASESPFVPDYPVLDLPPTAFGAGRHHPKLLPARQRRSSSRFTSSTVFPNATEPSMSAHDTIPEAKRSFGSYRNDPMNDQAETPSHALRGSYVRRTPRACHAVCLASRTLEPAICARGNGPRLRLGPLCSNARLPAHCR